MKLEKLNLSVRVFNVLKRAGIDTVEKLDTLSDMELQSIRNLGKRSFDEIKDKLIDLHEKPMQTHWKSIREDGLPPTDTMLIVTIYDSIHGRKELRYPVMYRKSSYCREYGFYEFGLEENKLSLQFSEVLAWIVIPDVYDGEVEE